MKTRPDSAALPRSLPLALVLAVLLAASPAQARLGETEAVCSQRYGSPVKAQQEAGRRDLWFRNGGFELVVSFRDNRAVRIAYRLESGEPISIKRIDEILRDNGRKADEALGTARLWHFQPSRQGGMLVVMEEEKGASRAEYDIGSRILVVRERTAE
ncbi:MAG: hypothetical protein AB1568_14165 [Thermodesulfobacteriota bacterium]